MLVIVSVLPLVLESVPVSEQWLETAWALAPVKGLGPTLEL